MTSLVNKCFPSKETKILLGALKRESRRFVTYSSSEAEEYVFDIIYKAAKSTIYTNENDNKLALKKKTSKNIILQLIIEITGSLIMNGERNNHFGVFDENSREGVLLSFFKKAVQLSFEEEFFTVEEKWKYLNEIESEIRLMGL